MATGHRNQGWKFTFLGNGPLDQPWKSVGPAKLMVVLMYVTVKAFVKTNTADRISLYL